MISKIISGGQTGADQGALFIADRMNVPTGGCAPRGWKTEAGPAPWLAGFGLYEHASDNYPARTAANIARADGTLIFGNCTSAGSRLTARYCEANRKPCLLVPWRSGKCIPPPEAFWRWVERHPDLPPAFVLNVAGNRESGQPGISDAVQRYLRPILIKGREA